jgi:hypothetical protein
MKIAQKKSMLRIGITNVAIPQMTSAPTRLVSAMTCIFFCAGVTGFGLYFGIAGIPYTLIPVSGGGNGSTFCSVLVSSA